jgi:hypothetical protein
VTSNKLEGSRFRQGRVETATSCAWRSHRLTKPWVTFRQPDQNREYLVLLTALPLTRFRDLGRFLLYTFRIQGQVRQTPGLLGYSLGAQVLKREFWTLSVWGGEAALREFVIEHPHSQVMRALQGKMGETRFVRWHLRGAELPPQWEDAFTRRDMA